ncbi:TMEM175 family protein [Cellulomonas fengjieae]|uniref:DUF1211 domain-containing protein n=1 Tax=Cellulomonas fengjieae TaxID=2819978 RepID=A0ABS3SKL6_9CELL|nr:TMEM175 family protein [Cellulomonas fengjieae]MBO3086292.1 DUF1211 domain-containing protein [Cellulomonas fengjieae]QVI65668.1 DUF1211 domain-containing protein [Cellulomonas fengjieae]
MPGIRTDRGLDRLVNFTDASVAIAITLLVLPLIDLVTDGTERSAGSLLTQEGGTFLAFGISFVVIASFWVGHHRVFEHLQDYSKAMLWANFLWLASIVFIPFTTQLLADEGTDDPAVNALYISTMVVTTGSLALIEWLAVRDTELQRPEVRGTLSPAVPWWRWGSCSSRSCSPWSYRPSGCSGCSCCSCPRH